ncbi:MAG: hypothetical protein IK139_06185, partial [Lachnospiraceae bacterium]|nr:hypothetical protein [Lachnospiraceae bacterium]
LGDRADDTEDNGCAETYTRYEEEHVEKAHNIVDIKQAAESAGLRLISITDGYSDDPLHPESTRAVFVVGQGDSPSPL